MALHQPAVARDPPKELLWPNAPPPMSVKDEFWVYAVRGGKRQSIHNSGEWLLFVGRNVADAVWGKIAKATTEGKLGPASKCATARPNPDWTNESKTVICVYTLDFEDHDDAMRVREELRRMGFEQPIPYKQDATTLEGKYANRGAWRVSALWA